MGSAAGFRVLLLYKRVNDSMSCRSCSSDDTSAWGPEGTVSGVSPDHGDVRRRRGQELGEELNTTLTNTITWTRVFWYCEQQINFSVYCFSFYSMEIQRQNHAVVSRTPRSEHVHPHAHDAAETPVILGS
jgi:hypothetical protein